NIDFPQDTAYYDIHMTVTNNYNGPVSFWWRLIKDSTFPTAWTTQVCDLNTCYFENVDKCPKNNPNTLAAGASSDAMYVKLNPKNTEGTTNLWLKIYSNSDLTNLVDSMLIVVVSQGTAQENLIDEQIAIFPNPAINVFSLKGELNNADQLEIIDVKGRSLQHSIIETGKYYNISGLPTGMYYVKIIDRQRHTIQTLRLLKD
ncbi:MAG TPA: T9SS type A sorting domain-containing protein, partial [Saprospiraceae bacterium]|nr:T9SS type A sorting domain-containing protein [Saprospiraceae bacterium]